MSKGIGYVEFEKVESIPKALTLSGTKLHGMPCIVQTTEAEKRLLEQQAAQGGLANFGSVLPSDVAGRRIYVGSLHYSLTENDISSIFDPFGKVEFVRMNRDPRSNESKGFAFIQFTKEEDARRAYEQMNGFELMGRKIRVGWVTEKTLNQEAAAMAPPRSHRSHSHRNEERLEDVEQMSGMNVSRAEMMKRLTRDEDMIPGPSGGMTMAAGGSGSGGSGSGSGVVGGAVGARASTDLPRSQPDGVPVTSVVGGGATAPPMSRPTRNCVLKNMFDPRSETEPTWADDIRLDVAEECSQFGKVDVVDVDRDHPDGHVYVRFDTVAASEAAVKALNGRWFAKKQIVAHYVVDPIFDARLKK